MPPGTEEMIRAASDRGGWEAIAVVSLMLVMIGAFVFLGKWFIASTDSRLAEAKEREDRLAARITSLEDFAHTTLVVLVREVTVMMTKNNEAINALTEALNKKLCVLAPERQDEVIDRLGDRVSARVIAHIRE